MADAVAVAAAYRLTMSLPLQLLTSELAWSTLIAQTQAGAELPQPKPNERLATRHCASALV